MIGLIVLALAGMWLLLSAKIARYGARKVRQPVLSFAVAVALFSVIALLPFADEIIGRWQFQRLCASEALVYVSPSASKVVAAKDAGGFSDRKGFVFPIREQSVRYADSTTGDIFYSV